MLSATEVYQAPEISPIETKISHILSPAKQCIVELITGYMPNLELLLSGFYKLVKIGIIYRYAVQCTSALIYQ